MKKVAITPDGKSNCALNQVIVRLTEKEVTHIYLRTSFFCEPFDFVIDSLKKNNITPIVSVSLIDEKKSKGIVTHFKEKEAKNRIDRQDEFGKYSPFSVSCHSASFAKTMLKQGASFVFVSPVFKPLSKKNDSRECFPLEKIRYLVKLYDEKIILLGGITNSKIEYLKKNIKGKFGIAGVTEFFADITGK